MKKSIILDIEPIGKVRMVRSDAWSGRVAVAKYWKYKDDLNKLANSNQYKIKNKLKVKFYLSMPKSWSSRKKTRMDKKPHDSKPDLDNLLKAFMDCLMENDSKVYKIESSKYWAIKGYIEVMI